MKKILLFSLFTIGLFAQTFTTNAITTSLDNAWQVYPIDLDGDGDMDLLSCAKNLPSENYMISWYENDGSEGFTPRTITTAA